MDNLLLIITHHPSSLTNHQFIKSEIIFQKTYPAPTQIQLLLQFSQQKKMIKKHVFFGPDFSLGFVGAGQRTESWPPTKPPPQRRALAEPFGAAGRTTGHVGGDLDPPSRIGGIGWVFDSHIIHGKNGYIYLHLDGWLIFFFWVNVGTYIPFFHGFVWGNCSIIPISIPMDR